MSGIVVGKTEGTYYIVYTYYNNIRIAAVTDTAGTAANEGMIGFGTGSTLVQEQTASGVSIATGEYHTLNVKVEGNTISAWIDDSTVVATYTVPEGSSIASAAPALFTRTILSGSDAFEAKNFKVTVGGKTMFACVDGPDFDGHQVNWDEIISRCGMYKEFEAHAREATCNLLNKEVE